MDLQELIEMKAFLPKPMHIYMYIIAVEYCESVNLGFDFWRFFGLKY